MQATSLKLSVARSVRKLTWPHELASHEKQLSLNHFLFDSRVELV